MVIGIMIAAYYIGEATELLFLSMFVIFPLAWFLFNSLYPEKPTSDQSSEDDKSGN